MGGCRRVRECGSWRWCVSLRWRNPWSGCGGDQESWSESNRDCIGTGWQDGGGDRIREGEHQSGRLKGCRGRHLRRSGRSKESLCEGFHGQDAVGAGRGW